MKKLVRILPFMEKEEIKELAYEIINEEVEGIKLVMLFPFLGNDDLDDIVNLLIEKKDGRSLQGAVPFARKETVDKIYKAVQNGDIEGIKETHLFPFLGKEQLKSMFKVFVKQAKAEAKENAGKEVHVHVRNHDDEHVDFDIHLDDEDFDDEINLEMDKLKDEMKELKKQLKKYKEESK